METKTAEIKMVRVRRLIDEAYNSDYIKVGGKGDISIPIPEKEAERMVKSFPEHWEVVTNDMLSNEEKKRIGADKILATPEGDGIAIMNFKGEAYNGDILRKITKPGRYEVPEKEGRRLARQFPKEWELVEIRSKTAEKTGKKQPVMVVETKPPAIKPKPDAPTIKINPDIVITKPKEKAIITTAKQPEPKKTDDKVMPKLSTDKEKVTRIRGKGKK